MPAAQNSHPGKVWEHSLPYRVILDEIRLRHPDVIPEDIENKLAAWEIAEKKVEDLRNREQADLNQYRKAQEDCAALEKPLKQIIHNAKLSGLCFSGGGIRSASFGLGVLTQLARLSGDRGVLNEIDYVSTVSGGGYVGSWLTGWIRTKKTLKAVIGELTGAPLTSTDPEPPPARHLRDYTSYLAPRTGALSTDTWTLAAIVLRNLLLNWAILIPAFAALLLLPVLNDEFLFWATSQRAGRLEFSAGALLFAVLALVYIACKLPGNCAETPKKTNYIWPGLCLLISAWCFAGFYLTDAENFSNRFVYIWLLALIAHGGLLAGRVVAIFRRGDHQRSWRNFGYQALISLPTSLFAAAMLWFLHTDVAPSLVVAGMGESRLFTTLYVPLVWLAFMLTLVLMDGLSARFEDDQDREWWSRAGAFMMRGALLWAAVHLLVLYGPDILSAANYVFTGQHAPEGATITFLTGVIGTLASWLGFTPATPSGRDKADWAKLKNIKGLLARNGLLVPALGGLFFILLALALADANDTIWPLLAGAINFQYSPALLGFALAAAVAVFFNVFVNVNTFSLHAMYRNRLIRSYLGASNEKRRPNPFTNFDPADDFAMACAPHDAEAPLHVVNMALNVVATKNLAWQQRKAESFTVSALHSGSFCVGYRRTREYGNRGDGISIGTAMAISGAAASPNMGYHSSPILTLAMTFFNARLGWWLPNPGPHGRKVWRRISPLFSLWPLLNEALGRTNDQNRWVYVSDGGHFENLGLYEMVVRRCKRIIVVDGGCDPDFNFEDLGNAVRKIFIDLGVPIDFMPAVSLEKGPKPTNHHVFFGTIRYGCVDGTKHPDGTDVTDGELLYIKASLTGDEPADVTQYYKAHPDFPHESTANQFFNESQFESYVRLGSHVVDSLGSEDKGPFSLEQIFQKLRPAPSQAAAGAASGKQ
ncbi:MAG: patatin-like phospholipase family protein [Actinomycetota bacterium]